jgi:tRNA dimethylallyltransferase
MKDKKVIIVVGPTGSGKSSLAFNLAKQFNGFLISADSRQVYQDMDIGTNKDLGQWQGVNGKKVYLVDGIEEYLVDFIKPDQEFTLADWLYQAKRLIQADQRLPIIVGGTGLYTTALVEGYELAKQGDKALRDKLNQEFDEHDLEYLVEKLKICSPQTAARVDIKNPRRVLRALEVCLSNDQDSQTSKKEPEFEFLQLGVSLPREKLYEKINLRVDQMIDEGLVDEVKALVAKGYTKDLPAMTGIGYRQIIKYLDGEIYLTEAIDLIKRDTRHYAKRQMTWYKKDKNINWVEDYQTAESLVQNFLTK